MREWKWNVVIQPENIIDYKEINNKVWLNNIEVSQRPILTISSWCHNRIRALHKKYPSTEWLAWCKIKNLWNGNFVMTDMIHPWQKISWTDVSITDEWMDRLVDYLIEQGEDLSEWNCVLHSHHSMGCFWSPTDDNARQSLNDWRSLAWAVVSSYKWEEIDYKGCINFYKPYPIEIDCDIQYETEDLYWQAQEWGDYLVNREKEIYNELVLTDEKLKELQTKYNYDRLLDYLGIDITKELEENAIQVAMKIPSKDYEERLKEIKEIAKEKTQEEIGGPIDNELTQRMEWNEYLDEQLEKAKEQKYSTLNTNTLGNFGKVSDRDLSNSWQDYEFNTKRRRNIPDYVYNIDNFPTKDALINTMWFNPHFEFKPDANWDWQVMNYSYYEPFWESVADVVEDLYEYEEDYLPRFDY